MPATRHARMIVAVLFAIAACPGEDNDPPPSMTDPTTGDSMQSSDDAEVSTDTTTGTTTAIASTGDETTGVMIDYTTQIQPIWDASCTCHLQGPSGTMIASVLTLNMGLSYDELVDTPSSQSPLVRVQPGDRQASYLWHKLAGSYLRVGGMGDPMPQVGMLTPEALDLIAAWIDAGAPP
jgi:hypothetical protein